jgi:1-acyl-sn-glycerol-3-phosphate acyltransferase
MTQSAAIVGIGCRFPGGANSPEQFWQLLREGVEAISEVPPDRFDVDSVFDPDPARKGTMYTRRGGFVEEIDEFDAAFFGFSPREASRVDPQHRLLLEIAYEAVEDAGMSTDRIAGTRTGVFVGYSAHDYSSMQMYPFNRHLIDSHSMTGGASSIAANRISYMLDLRGPSFIVDTACSSALTAVHLAMRSLRNGECDLALAGGAQLNLTPEISIGFCKASMISPDGRCHAFDARANGYVRGEGGGLVLLKPLDAALADGDRIYAVLVGTGVNQDGGIGGMTVPSVVAQEEMLRAGLADAGLEPSAVQYAEAHGTGTPVGDPIEAAALGAVFGSNGERFPIGSVKTNIGHLEAAAGAAGLIKSALALHHGEIPPSLNFEEPSPDIDFDALALRVVTELEPWPSNGAARTATINSFGFGGANANAVLQEAPSGEAVGDTTAAQVGPYLLPLSARSPEARDELAALYVELLEGADEDAYLSICRAAARRRAHHDVRLAVVAQTAEEASEALGAVVAGRRSPSAATGRRKAAGPPSLAFVFSGMGPQWWAMGRELAAEEPVFAKALERCDEIFEPLSGWSLREELQRDEADSRMEKADVAQVTNVAIQIALADLWASWGITPDAVVGHSVGEIAAAHVAGALTLEDTMLLAYHRSRLQAQTAGQGKMLAAGIPEAEAETLLGDLDGTVSLAAVNAPSSVTLSGDPDVLEQLRASLEAEGRFARLLPVDVPYHSPKMDPLQDELLSSLEPMRPRDAEVPFVSIVTGTWHAGTDLGAAYWWQNVRRPVRFGAAIECLADEGITTYLEVGPHPVLSISVKECLRERESDGTVLSSLRRGEKEREFMLRSLGALFAEGREPRWETLYPGTVAHVPLPTYPWQRERHWFESSNGDGAITVADPDEHPLLGRRLRTPEARWEVSFDDHRLAYLHDHVIQGTRPVPAAAFVEMGLAVSRRLLGHAAPAVQNVEFKRAFFLGSESQAVQVGADQSSRRFDVQSPPPDPDSPWTLLAGGSLAGGAAREESVDLSDLRARCPRSLERADLYEQLSERGYDYGPAFQGLEWAGAGEGEALAALGLEETVDTGAYELHPSLLDAAFQLVIFAASSELADVGPTDGFLPVSVREVQVHGKAEAGSFAHARVVETTSGAVEGDVDILAEDGTLLVEIRGLHAKHLESTGEEQVANWLYELRWEEDTPQDAETVAAAAIAEWLVVGGDPELAQELASALELKGASPTVVPAEPERLDEAIGRLTPSAPAGVVYLGALEAPVSDGLSADLLVESQVRLCGEVRELATGLGADGSGPRSLVLVTAGAEQATETDKSDGLAQSALWGLGRVIGHELPLERCRLIDLPSGFSKSDLSSLAAELLTSAPEEEIALRDERRYVRRLRRLAQADLVPTMRDSSPGDHFRAEIGTPGMLESVRMASVGRTEPGPGQVEIEVAVASLNFRDVMLAMGLLPQLALAELPGTDRIGLDYAGTVSAVGEGVEGLTPGDEVIGVAYGTVASHVTTPAEFVLPKPASLDFEEAAAVPVAFVTSYISLVKLARLQPGERVLIHAATGGVGLAAIQIARDLGAEIYATAGTPEKREYLRSLGVEEIFDSRTLAFADEIRERTNGEGVDVVLNSLSGEAIGTSLATLAPSGRFVELGKRDIYEDASLHLLEFRKNLSYFAVDLDRLLAEQPEHVGSLFQEVLAKFEDGTYEAPPRNRFSSAELSEALRHMAQAKHIGKVVVAIGDETVQIATRSAEGPQFRQDGAYLVTGGLGGFGLAVASWLAARGAGTLVLAGRSEPGPETQKAIEELRSLGARVEVMQADVSRQEQVAELVGTIRANVGPLRGIVHAAMVLDDGLLPQLDDNRFERVLAPKVAGAWNLHELTANEPLDFFVSFSSISSLFGNVGQGNYAAANSLLDAFAHYRRSRGLPALTVNWGALSGVGYLSRQEAVGEQLTRQGFAGFSPAEAVKVLGELIDTDRPQVMAARVAWDRLAAMSSADAASPRLRHLVPAGDGSASADVGGAPELAGLLTASPADAARLAQEYLQNRIGLVLGSGSATIDPDRPLTDLGLDSLMAVELLATLKSELGVEVAVVQLLQGVTLADLAGLVLAELEPRRSATPTAEPPVASEEPVSDTDEPVSDTEPAAKVAVDGNGRRPTVEPAPEERASEPAQPHTRIREHWTPGQRLARGIVGLGVRMAARVEVEGLEHVPSSGAFILAGNHLSMSDVPVGWPQMERSIIPLVSQDLRQTRWLRWVLSGIGHAVYIRRGEGDKDALTRGLAVLRAGGAILIAPEGRRSPGGLRRGNTGAAYLATRAGVPVIPVAAWGQEDFTSSWRRLRRAPVRLHFGPPLDLPVAPLSGQELLEHSERIMLAIARMLPPEYRGVYADAVAAEGVEEVPGGVTQERDTVGITEPQ